MAFALNTRYLFAFPSSKLLHVSAGYSSNFRFLLFVVGVEENRLTRSAEVKLVKSRDDDARMVVSSRQTDQASPDDLVALAQQLSAASGLVKARACDRLRGIAEQMEQLQKAAVKILEEAKRDEELHNVPCNVQKHPGRVYHLYRRSDGSKYFSLLSPEEWSRDDKTKEYVASYRMEMDRSFTPMAEVAKRDAQFRSLEAFLKQSKFKNEFNMGMILNAEQSGS